MWGLALDLTVRAETDNQRGLDDLMRRVYTQYGASGTALTTDTVQRLAEEISGADLNRFFSTYVKGATLIPLTDYMKLAGLEVAAEDDALRWRQRGDVSDVSAAIARSVF